MKTLKLALIRTAIALVVLSLLFVFCTGLVSFIIWENSFIIFLGLNSPAGYRLIGSVSVIGFLIVYFITSKE